MSDRLARETATPLPPQKDRASSAAVPDAPATGTPEAEARWGDVMTHLRRPPGQARARITAALLLDAAEQALTEHGIERFTTGDVARISGMSIGTVYKYFDDRVAILDAIRPHRFDAHNTLVEITARLHELHAATTGTLTPEQQDLLEALIARAQTTLEGDSRTTN